MASLMAAQTGILLNDTSVTLDVLLNKELVSIILNFLPLELQIKSSTCKSNLKNVLCCAVVCKTWHNIIQTCDNVWFHIFFEKFADYHRFGYGKYSSMVSDVIEDWEVYNFTWKPCDGSSMKIADKKDFYLATVLNDPNASHLDKFDVRVVKKLKRGNPKIEFTNRCKFISTDIIDSLNTILECNQLSPDAFQFLTRHPATLFPCLTKINDRILRNRLAYPYRKAFNYRCDTLVWVSIHTN